MDKHIGISIILFVIVDVSVVFALFLPEWIISNIGGEIQVGLVNTCLVNRKKGAKCFASLAPTEWNFAIFLIVCGCAFVTLAIIAFIGSYKARYLVSYGRWLGLASLACFCLASIFIPMGFSMESIKGEPFQLPSSFYAGFAYILFNISIWVTAISELFAGKICLPNF